jgi:hypothetical protein
MQELSIDDILPGARISNVELARQHQKLFLYLELEAP